MKFAISNPFKGSLSAVAGLVKPLVTVSEIATESAEALMESHRKDRDNATEITDAVRAKRHADELAMAMAAATDFSVEVKEIVRTTQIQQGVSQAKDGLHKVKMTKLMSISEEAMEALAAKATVTDADILKAAGVGVAAKPSNAAATTTNESVDMFDLSQFQNNPS